MGVFKKLRVILNNNLERLLHIIYTEFNNKTSNGKIRTTLLRVTFFKYI